MSWTVVFLPAGRWVARFAGHSDAHALASVLSSSRGPADWADLATSPASQAALAAVLASHAGRAIESVAR